MIKKPEPLVSVIMAAFNSSAFINESIESVKGQTYANWELIIVDDASEDNTSELSKAQAQNEPRIEVHSLRQNKGAGHARNCGVEIARGAYIAFLDSDDLWEPTKLQVQIELMQSQNLSMSFCSYDLIDENGAPKNITIEALPVLSFKRLLKANYVGNLTGVYSVDKLGKVYSPVLRKRQDWAMWLKILQKSGEGIGIKESLARYRLRRHSISHNKLEMLWYNYAVYRKVLGFSRSRSVFLMLVFLKEQIFVKKKQQKPSTERLKLF